MSSFGPAPQHKAAQGAGDDNRSLPQIALLIRSGVGFCLVSLVVFATVAFGQRWMYRQFGQLGAYAVWTVLFIVLGGAMLNLLVVKPDQRRRFYAVFGLAFLAYATTWTTAYFAFRDIIGEWIGSLAGSAILGGILAMAFGAKGSMLRIIVGLVFTHSTGYFVGSLLHRWIEGKPGMLLWGLCYGLLFGLGLGQALYLAQTPSRRLVGERPQTR
jgi:hypothetical protein